MALEIERKFRLNELGEEWVKAWMPKTDGYGTYKGSLAIHQGYLLMSPEKTIRVRYQTTMNEPEYQCDGYVTRKTSVGLENAVEEEEYRIPREAALILLDICPYVVTKHRVHYEYNGRLWEVDLFTDKGNTGLNIAELEFKTLEDAESFNDLPPWIGDEVTTDPKYKNAMLALHPYNTW